MSPNKKTDGFKSNEHSGHALGKKRLMTRSSAKSNEAIASSRTYGYVLESCTKMVYLSTRLCCSCGTTNVCIMPWYRLPIMKHVTGPDAVISSKKNGQRKNVALKRKTVTFGECRGISACIRWFSSAQIRQFCVLTVPVIEMSIVVPQNIPRKWQIISHSVEPLWVVPIKDLLYMLDLAWKVMHYVSEHF